VGMFSSFSVNGPCLSSSVRIPVDTT
jgi:hypothetical protein